MTIYSKLMNHQELILDFIKDKKYFGIFADYGTGKTLCALALIDKLNIRKTLVISTKTAIKGTWPREIKKHTNFKMAPMLGDKKQKLNTLYHGLRASMTSAGMYHSEKVNNVIFLVNFDGVKGIFNELLQADFDLVLIDESTKIKSPKTLRTKVMWKLGETAPKKGIMTGFPITENISEIYAQIKFLDNGEAFGNSYFNFMETYFNRAGYKYVAKKKGVEEILQKIKPYCIRVSKDVIKLPPKVNIVRDIELTPEQTKLLESLNSTFRLEFGKVHIDTQYIFAIINKSLQICDGFIQSKTPKLDERGNPLIKKDKEGKDVQVMVDVLEMVPTNKDEAIIELIEEADPRKNKILVWFTHVFPLKKIAHILTKMGYSPLTLYGETDNEDEVVNRFQHGKYNILLATQKKASDSITLTACRDVFYYSSYWSADLRNNSEARTHRKGSEIHESVIYTDLVTSGTIEEDVMACLKEKKSLVDELKTRFGGING